LGGQVLQLVSSVSSLFSSDFNLLLVESSLLILLQEVMGFHLLIPLSWHLITPLSLHPFNLLFWPLFHQTVRK
jgi:hypothetical protein